MNPDPVRRERARGDAPRPSLAAPDPELEGRRLLAVDDDPRNLYVLGELLEPLGATLLRAAGGREALEALDRDPTVDLVIMDVMMPGLDGLEATRRIRAQRRFRDLPIVVLTARALAEDREEAIGAGASDYLAKPVDAERLLLVLRAWLRRY
ncbi:MAG: response regulator [Planctomycetota bacterium]